MDWWPVALVVVLAMGFTYTNGFHDAANAIATSVTTRALTPRIALGLGAVMNLLGAFAGMRVAETIGSDIVVVPTGATGIVLCVGALVGATGWNLLTWWRGLPSSSTHALVGGLGGAALAAGASVQWGSVRDKVAIPMVVSPVVGVVGGFLVMTAILWIFRRASPGPTARGFRYAQTVSAAAMAFGHGMQDATKTAGVVALALVAAGHQPADDPSVPLWVIALSAVVLSLGSAAGGWRIMRTLGRGIIHLDPPQGFAAEATAASVLYVATATGAPISTTHAITAAITGVGATRSAKAVRWGVARSIVLAWVLTFPGAGLAAALVYGLLSPLT
ncbi:inorganic phosphate transporter [Phycicoccus duodecadis]|uniref:PiT family inorganic phosphate transporter n=1 Tax=Phycicoccus duodecadis TaxID=173053 RepID=A0A2N3YIM4_9MICO|nr:inorganic phosphate transporter [Phycicoccus duodecadis]PKW26668.1 PiT family inorganic phosphate transporter [Phycicoccus duodecadis]